MIQIPSEFSIVLAAAEGSSAFTALEYDVPESTLGWIVGIGVATVLVVCVVWLYLKDTASFRLHTRIWLVTLRLAVVALIGVIALNPHSRTQQTSYLPSRIAILIDTSVSMADPERLTSGDATAADQPDARSPAKGLSTKGLSRSEAVAQLLSGTPLIEMLQKHHDVAVYTFNKDLGDQPHAIFYRKAGKGAGASRRGRDSAKGGTDPDTDTEIDSDSEPGEKPGFSEKPGFWSEVVEPVGLETRLGESLLKAVQQLEGDTLSRIIVISDGGSNAGIRPQDVIEEALASKVKLVNVGVGSPEKPVNLKLARLQAPSDVQINDPFEISVFVQAEGLAGRKVDVLLSRKPEGSDEEPIPIKSTDEHPNPKQETLREDGTPVEVKFQSESAVVGNIEFIAEVKLTQTASENRSDDNVRQKRVSVTDRKTRVLLMAGGPMRDYRFVRNLLHRHKGIDVDVWLQSIEPGTAARVSQDSNRLLLQFPPTARDLFEYDVVIGFDPDWKRISPEGFELLNQWVSKQGGGLILIAGNIYTTELANASDELQIIRDLYPVFLHPHYYDPQENRADQAYQIEWTREGQGAGFLSLSLNEASSQNQWKRFPGVYRCYPTGGAKGAATVYAYFSDPRTQTENGQPILMAAQYYGAGRILYMGSAEFWRLRSLGEEYYDRLWTKAVREVSQGRRQRGSSRGMFLWEKKQYVLGQTVRLRCSLLDPQMKELSIDSVGVEIFKPNGQPLIPFRRLIRDKSSPGQFIGNFRANLPGKYRIELSIPEADETLSGEIEVLLPDLEAVDSRQHAKVLKDLARETGGLYLTIDELSAMFDEVKTLRTAARQMKQSGDQTAAAENKTKLETAEHKLDADLATLFPNEGKPFIIKEQLKTLWDRDWILYLLVGLLSIEWLTRKLLKLA